MRLSNSCRSNAMSRPARLYFNGELLDTRTGHYLLGLGYRVYNPVLMRFHSPDTQSPFERGGVNAYAYCLGDPVNLIDPDGHAPWSALVAYASKHSGFSMQKLSLAPKVGVFTPTYVEVPMPKAKINRVNSLSSLDDFGAHPSSSLGNRKKTVPEANPGTPLEVLDVPEMPLPRKLDPAGKKPAFTTLDGTNVYEAGMLLHPPKGPGKGERLRNYVVRKVNRILGVGDVRDTSR